MSHKNPNNQTTLIIDGSLYTLSLDQMDRLATEFYGIALAVTNEDGNTIEITFDGVEHRIHSEEFIGVLDSTFRRV